MKKLLLGLAVATVATSAFAAASVPAARNAGEWQKGHLNAKGTSAMKAPTRADNTTITFGYTSEFADGLGTGNAGVKLAGAIAIPEEIASVWKGGQIKAVNIGFGQSTQTNVSVFIGTSLNKPEYTQPAILKPSQWNTVTLTTPYEVTGDELYIGYSLTTKAASDYPLGIDTKPTDNPFACLLGINGQWYDYSTQFGSLSIQVVVEGVAGDQYVAYLMNLNPPYAVKPNENFSVEASVLNAGTAPITSDMLAFSATVGTNQYDNLTGTMVPASIKPGAAGTVTISGLQCPYEGLEVPFRIELTKVNGKEFNDYYETTLLCLTQGYDRAVVVEEGTGTWCGWCPRGIVGMEYMRENYSDKGFIGIAVHVSSSSPDPMQVSSYMPVVNQYFDSFPNSMFNRMLVGVDPNTDYLQQGYDIIRSIPALGAVGLKVSASDDISELNVEATTVFGLDLEDADYRLAFVVTQDNVGPYYQQNYYAGGQNGKMDGWETKSSRVSTIYNEVARNIKDAFGIEGSLPSAIEGGKVYTYSTTIETNLLGESTIADISTIALLINNKTGYIENAVKVEGIGQAAVEAVRDDAPEVAVMGGFGSIVIRGAYGRADVYSLDGRRAAVAGGESNIAVAPGIYVVLVDGIATKVIVK